MSGGQDKEDVGQRMLNISQGEMFALDRRDGFFIVKSGY